MSSRLRGDDGVVAVVTAVLVSFVLLPVSALGLSTYVRSGVNGEMQRAADAGALAAATSLLFLDVDGLNFASDGAKLLVGPACSAAEVSLGGWTPTRDVAPLSAAFAATSPVSCRAGFSPDDAYPECITHLVANGQAVLDASTAAAMRVVAALEASAPAVVAPVVAPVFGALTPVLAPVAATGTAVTDTTPLTNAIGRRIALANRVFALIPAAQSDGVSVTLQHSVRGPLDGLLLRTAATPRTVTSTSRRLFKPLLPTSAGLARVLSGPVAAADPDLADTLRTTLSDAGQPLVTDTEAEVVRQLQSLLVTTAQALVDAGMALEGVDDAVADVSSAALVRSQARSLHAELVAAAPAVPRELLDLMLLEPLPVPRVNPLNPTCQAAARELVRALSRALQLNDDEKDLTTCLADELLGLPGARSNMPRVCVAGLFRAQLRPNPTRLLPLVSP